MNAALNGRRLAASLLAANAAPALAALPATRFPGVVCRARGLVGRVVLTFDDGPSPVSTHVMLEALAAAGVTATFFVVGEQVLAHRTTLDEVVAAGHEVALHGHRHLPHALLPPPAVLRDLERGLATVEDALGAPLHAIRAPFGAVSAATVYFATRHRLTLAGWNRWGRDWQHDQSPSAITRRLAKRARAGDILLLHDADRYSAAGCWRATARAIPSIVETLEERGLQCVPLGDHARRGVVGASSCPASEVR